jgi:hypothetical protein
VALLPTAACSSSRPTSTAEVKTVLTGCGIEESELLWMIDDKGSFLFGRPSDATPPLAPAKHGCLMNWVDKEKVRTGPLGIGAVR